MRNLRGALHTIADILADAIEADEREARIHERRKPTPKGSRPVGESSKADAKAAEQFLSDLRKTGT